MTRIAAARDDDLSGHVAAQLSADDLAWADLLVMDADNHRQLLARYPDQVGHIRLLDASGIPDPWLVDEVPAYANALDWIERAVDIYLAGLGQDAGDQRSTRG
jgi:protein-tyrosine-phosphatase